MLCIRISALLGVNCSWTSLFLQRNQSNWLDKYWWMSMWSTGNSRGIIHINKTGILKQKLDWFPTTEVFKRCDPSLGFSYSASTQILSECTTCCDDRSLLRLYQCWTEKTETLLEFHYLSGFIVFCLVTSPSIDYGSIKLI